MMQFQKIIMVMEAWSNTCMPPFFKKFRIMKYLTSALFCTKIEPYSLLRTIYMPFQKKLRSVKKLTIFHTLRCDFLSHFDTVPLLKKCTFFSCFKHHISVSNHSMKLIFDSDESWDNIFFKNKHFEKWGGEVCGFETTRWLL